MEPGLTVLAELATVLALGTAAQWIAWWMKLPSILLLLTFGCVAGPVLGIVEPDRILGRELLMALVSFSVAIIMFEGGLSLRIHELGRTGVPVALLVTLGAFVSGAIGAIGAHAILGLSWPISLLLGSVLVVTGPTVVGPILRHVRANRQVTTVLHWEGTLIDVLGAIVAVLVLEVVIAGRADETATVAHLARGMVETMLVGAAMGGAGAYLMLVTLRNHWAPDYLQSPMTFAVAVASFAGSNLMMHESGVVAVTVMGIALANQRQVTIRHVREFEESLSTLLIASLFILLSARMELDEFKAVQTSFLPFLALLVLVGRPLSVLVSTMGTALTGAERSFVAWMAPRGILTAGMSVHFADRLGAVGIEEGGVLVPLTFLVIVSTSLIYGLTARPLARGLGVAPATPHGVVIVGAHPFARQLGSALQDEKVPVILVDRDPERVKKARLAGLDAVYHNIAAPELPDSLDLSGIERLLAVTANDEVNSLACQYWMDVLGRSEVYQVLPDEEYPSREANLAPHLNGRPLFAAGVSGARLNRLIDEGYVVKKTPLTEQFTFEDFERLHRGKAIPLMLLRPEGGLTIVTPDSTAPPAGPGLLISLCRSSAMRARSRSNTAPRDLASR